MSTQTTTDTTETSPQLPKYGAAVRAVSHARRGHGEPRTRGDGATNRWIRLAHTSLNQAKMAAPRTASAASSSSVPHCP